MAGLFGAARPLLARSRPGAWIEQDKVFSAEVKVVNVLATVRNRKGEIIQDLTRTDFTLTEDGRRQVIRYFSQEANLPLTLGLLVDTSMSQQRVLGEEQIASYRFLEQVLREDKDMAFVVHFDAEVELLQDLTSSRKQLESVLTMLDAPVRQMSRRGLPGPRGPRGGGTALYDAVFLASDELMKKQEGRKALILLSDGGENSSKVTLDEAIEAAQRADTLIYSILFADEERYGMGFGGGPGRGGRGPMRMEVDGTDILKRLSKATGGGFFEVSKKRSLEQIYAQIEQELRHQYNLGYTSDRDTGRAYRKIHVTTKRSGLVVQAREGYYAD